MKRILVVTVIVVFFCGCTTTERVKSDENTSQTSLEESTDFCKKNALFCDEDKQLVVVFFLAQWCNPCVLFDSKVIEIIKNSHSNVKFIKIDTDKFPDIARDFRVRGIPTTKILKNGKEVDQIVGAVPPETIEELIEKHDK